MASPSAAAGNLQPDEQRIVDMYGRLPSRANLLNKKLRDRKYFDSGDYALSQAGKSSTVGSEHPYDSDLPPQHVASSLRTSNTLSPTQSPPLGANNNVANESHQQNHLSPGASSPPKVVGDPQAYNQQSATGKTPGTVPILSPVRDRSSSLSPPDADIANEAVKSYQQKLAAAQRMQ